MERYIRQLALPEMDLLKQERLSKARILMVGAGGLGAPALPYLAAAGIGHLTIVDHDTIDLTNLHRQTIYQSAQAGQHKALCAKAYLEALNPECHITAITEKITKENYGSVLGNTEFDLILDGSDNFETKSLLNDLSLKVQTPLLSASVNQFQAQIALFEGYKSGHACYRCLFPEFPHDARNCNEAGILGTSAGISGTLQAHKALLYLTDIKEEKENTLTLLNTKTIRIDSIKITEDTACNFCQSYKQHAKKQEKEKNMVELISIDNLNDEPTAIIDVRQAEELEADPLQHAQIKEAPVHIPLPEFVARIDELPEGKRLAFVCAGNVRSRQAAEYLFARGREDVCILDKFSL